MQGDTCQDRHEQSMSQLHVAALSGHQTEFGMLMQVKTEAELYIGEVHIESKDANTGRMILKQLRSMWPSGLVASELGMHHIEMARCVIGKLVSALKL